MQYMSITTKPEIYEFEVARCTRYKIVINVINDLLKIGDFRGYSDILH